MSDYAVVNPATGETVKEYPTISDDDLRDAIGRADTAVREWSASTTVEERAQLVRRVGEIHAEQRERLAEIIVREMGKPVEQALGELDFCTAIYEYYADNAPKLLADEDDRAARRRRLGDHPPQPLRRPARDHAVELPLLPGGALRGPEPGDRQHDPAQARAAVPGVGRGDAGDLHRGRLPGGRVHQHLRDQRADRVGHRRPARARRLADRLGARRRGRRRDRRAQPQEDRARAGRVGPVHPARRPTTSTTAVENAVAARVDNTGQSCNAAKRFIVVDELYEPFLEKFTDAITEVEPGDPTKSETEIGPLSSSLATERLADQLQRALDKGAKLVAGGEPRGQLLQDHRAHRHRRRTTRPATRSSSARSRRSTASRTRRRRSSSPTTRPTASART